MDHQVLLATALRGVLVFAAALLAVLLLRRAASSTRRLVLALGLGAALVLPGLTAVLPAWHVETPSIALPLRGKIVAEPVMEGAGSETAPAAKPAPAMAGATKAGASSAGWIDAAQVGACTWALGALLLVARLGRSLARVRAIARRASPAPRWDPARRRIEASTGVRLDVRETSELDAPAVCGVLAPVVLVPRAAERWDEQRRHHVLLHEVAHVRRRDGLVQVVADLAVALHWFDPLAWLCARRLRVERELAADDAALEHGARPSRYAEDLLAVSGARPAPAAAMGMGEPARLVARVVAVLAKGRKRAPLGSLQTAAVVLAASSGALALACTTPTGAGGPPASASTVGGATAGSPAAAAAPSPVTTPLPAAGAGSSIDPAIQAIADEELDRTIREWAAPAGAAVVLDPSTGRVLADAGRDRGTHADVGRLRPYVTGSTLKVVTLAAALDAGLVTPEDTIDCERGDYRYGGKTVHDWRPNGVLPLPQVLAVSSNIGFAKLFDRVGGDRLVHELRALHFGAPPGWMPDHVDDHSMPGALAAIGGLVTATPLQVAAAYAAIAGGGSYVEPTFSAGAGAATREPVMKPETARAIVAMLDEAVNGEHGTGKQARVVGARVAGKTGTAAWDLPGGGEGRYASFVGMVPEQAPRFVILVGVEQPKDDGTGVDVAAPAFARIATRALAVAR
jgi:cell division protein FtsI (penicillin-binding protein 3)